MARLGGLLESSYGGACKFPETTLGRRGGFIPAVGRLSFIKRTSNMLYLIWRHTSLPASSSQSLAEMLSSWF